MKPVLRPVALAGAMALASGCVTVDSQGHIAREEKHFTLTGSPDLRVITFDGSIEVRSWDKKEVQVEIEKRGPSAEAIDRIQVTAQQNGDHIELEAKGPRAEFGFFGIGHVSLSARLIVTMPKDGDLYARSGDGSIRVENLSGHLELRTGDGSIRANDISGRLTLNTGDGSVVLDGVEGDIDLETGDGGVTIAGKPSTVRAHTGDGSITFKAQPGTVMKDDWSISTGDGSVSVFLPADFSALLDAHTGDGTIHSDLTVTPGPGGEMSKHTVRGQLKDGGRLLKIRTGDGGIRLRTN